MCLTPIDIATLDSGGEIDTQNHYAVIPGFSRMPVVNDRMIYGPYEAVKIWSTKRFEVIEERVKLGIAPGVGHAFREISSFLPFKRRVLNSMSIQIVAFSEHERTMRQ
jgi:hypothetical protein